MKAQSIIKALNKAGLIMVILASTKFYGDSFATIIIGVLIGSVLFFIPSE